MKYLFVCKLVLSTPKAVHNNEKIYIIAPAGISPRGEIPRRHPSNSRVYLRTLLTVQIYSQYTRKNLDLLEQGPRGIGR